MLVLSQKRNMNRMITKSKLTKAFKLPSLAKLINREVRAHVSVQFNTNFSIQWSAIAYCWQDPG